MELRQIRYFVTVAEERNLSAAARLLHVSQPPVTRQIQQLEAELGYPLFTRGAKGVELTPAGDTFLIEARKILAQCRRATEFARAAGRGDRGVLNVAYFGSSVYDFVPRLLRRYRLERPDVKVRLSQLSKYEQVDALREGRLQIGFARYYPYDADIVERCVGHEQLYFATLKDSGSAWHQTAIEDLKDERLILFPKGGRPSFVDEIIGLFAKRGLSPHIAHLAEDVTAALALTASGLGPTFVPESVARLAWPGIVFIPVAGPDTTLPISCIHLVGSDGPILTPLLKLMGQGAR